MAKKMPFLAAIICSIMMLTSTANAGWLDIIKGIANAFIGGDQKTSLQQSAPNPPPSSAPAPTVAPVPSAPPTQKDTLAALDQLSTVCKNLSSQGFPCAIGEDRGITRGSAAEGATTKAIYAMGQSMSAYVKGNSEAVRNKIVEDGIPMEQETFNSKMAIEVDNVVNGSQIYMTYTYTEQRERNGKPITVYVVTEVRILNAALFENALDDISKGKPVSKSIFEKTRDIVADRVKASLK